MIACWSLYIKDANDAAGYKDQEFLKSSLSLSVLTTKVFFKTTRIYLCNRSKFLLKDILHLFDEIKEIPDTNLVNDYGLWFYPKYYAIKDCVSSKETFSHIDNDFYVWKSPFYSGTDITFQSEENFCNEPYVQKRFFLEKIGLPFIEEMFCAYNFGIIIVYKIDVLNDWLDLCDKLFVNLDDFKFLGGGINHYFEQFLLSYILYKNKSKVSVLELSSGLFETDLFTHLWGPPPKHDERMRTLILNKLKKISA